LVNEISLIWNNHDLKNDAVRKLKTMQSIENYLFHNKEKGWYCLNCDTMVFPEQVTFEKLHDPRTGGCGHKLVFIS